MMRFDKLKTAYLDHLRIGNYAEGTLFNRSLFLEEFLAFLEQEQVNSPSQLTKAVLWGYRQRLVDSRLSDETISSKLSKLRHFLRFLLDRGYILLDFNVLLETPKMGVRLPRHILSEQEMKDFLSLPDVKTHRGIRDRAIFELLYSTGMRRGELLALDLYDLNTQTGTVKVFGKGKKQRILPLGKFAGFWVCRYIKAVRPFCLDNPREQALFISLREGTRLKPQSINTLIARYRKLGGMQKPISPHAFRHACATHLLRGGADIRYVQKLLGHHSIKNTQIYTHLDVQDLKAILKKTHPRG